MIKRTDMNNFKFAIRNLTRNRIYTILNILGLTVGITASLLISSVIFDDLSYDRQWRNSNQIYRVITVSNNSKADQSKMSLSFAGLGPEMKKNFPEVRDYCRMSTNSEELLFPGKSETVAVQVLSSDPSIAKFLDLLRFMVRLLFIVLVIPIL